MQIKLLLELGPPKGPSRYTKPEKKKSIEEEVREALDCIESGHDSYTEWKLINKLAEELRDRKDARAVNIMRMISPIMDKYGMHGVSEK